VNLATGAATLVGGTGLQSGDGDGMSFSGATLYFASSSGLYTLNQGTGVATFVASLSGAFSVEGDRLNAMDVQPGTGTMFASERTSGTSRLVTVNLATGVVTDVGLSVNRLDGLAFATAIPATPTPTPTATATSTRVSSPVPGITPSATPTATATPLATFVPTALATVRIPPPVGAGVLGVLGAARQAEVNATARAGVAGAGQGTAAVPAQVILPPNTGTGGLLQR
jgi:hypothetical protein